MYLKVSKFPVSFSLYITGILLMGGEGGRIFPKLSHLGGGGGLRVVDVEIGGCFFYYFTGQSHLLCVGAKARFPLLLFGS